MLSFDRDNDYSHVNLILMKVGGKKSPTSAKSARKLGGVAVSSIKKAIERLMALKIVFYIEGEYRFTNPFFRAWLLYKKL